uniref:Uncharacterized protein n=1 Tax=Physcomitrium patens TaxID=3218 RepID=A0A2K1IJG6_PHYPA|nr:hypothetical protein PHYPA_028108 [Physcomitrium patens]
MRRAVVIDQRVVAWRFDVEARQAVGEPSYCAQQHQEQSRRGQTEPFSGRTIGCNVHGGRVSKKGGAVPDCGSLFSLTFVIASSQALLWGQPS